MKTTTWSWLAVVALAGAAAAEEIDVVLSPDVVEGAVWAAECVATPGATRACNQPALAAGKPGGLLHGGVFTALLIDGHVLARTCATGGDGLVRAAGVRHPDGHAMTVFRLEENCGQGWTAVDMPHSGVSATGAAGGEE
jgi:hypothetical protein